MRSFFIKSLFVLTVFCSSDTARTQDPPEIDQSKGEFFSGIVVDLTADKVTVDRTILGKDSATRTFIITPETRVEGKLKIKARVTVRFVSGGDGDRAVHIIVRK